MSVIARDILSRATNDGGGFLETTAKAVIAKDKSGNLGPYMISWIFDYMLFGVMLHQLAVWSSTASTDRLFVKITVIWMALVSTAVTVYSFYCMFGKFIWGFGIYANFAQVDFVTWYTVLTIGVSIPSQIFYTERAYRLLREKFWVPLIVLPFIILQTVGAIGVKALGSNQSALTVADRLNTWFCIFLSGTLGADVVVTGLIIAGLIRTKTGWSQTDRIVHRLIRVTFESQLPPTIGAIVFLTIFSQDPHSRLNTFQFVHAKFYVVCLLGVLNSRITLRRDLSGDGPSNPKDNSYPLSNYQQRIAVFDNPAVSGTDSATLCASSISYDKKLPDLPRVV